MQRASLLAAVLARLPVVLPVGAASALTVDRTAGTDQYGTAIAVAKRMVTAPLAQSSRTAIITSGSDGADVLVAPFVSRANQADASELNEWVPPVLLVKSGQPLVSSVEAELRLRVVGGTGDVSDAAANLVRC
jgi:hypothetical protein